MIAVSAFLLAAAICATSCAPWPQGRSDFNPARDSLPRDEPQPVYGPDRADPWNQVFYLLFTRTLRARLAADGAELFAAGDDRLTLSPRTVTRIESGDRAIDPLYPSWLWMGSSEFDISPSGSWGILSDPRAAELEAALHRVRQTARAKPPLARALMQHDLWAAYDMLSAPRSFAWPRGLPSDAAAATRRKRDALVALVAASMKSLALTRAEIASLPATYAAAAARHGLPDLFSAAGGWMEVRWSPRRSHDDAVHDRRATRVFIKRSAASADAATLLDALRDSDGAVPAGIEAAALVTEIMLVAADGSVVPSPITFEVQLRMFTPRRQGGDEKTQLRQYELSRKLLLSSPDSGGLAPLDENAPAYLPAAGNDLAFATRPRLDAEPVVVPLRRRCAVCHGSDLTKLVTFALIHDPQRPRPPVERLNPSENTHAHEVAARKTGREEFLALLRLWAIGPA